MNFHTFDAGQVREKIDSSSNHRNANVNNTVIIQKVIPQEIKTAEAIKKALK